MNVPFVFLDQVKNSNNHRGAFVPLRYDHARAILLWGILNELKEIFAVFELQLDLVLRPWLLIVIFDFAKEIAFVKVLGFNNILNLLIIHHHRIEHVLNHIRFEIDNMGDFVVLHEVNIRRAAMVRKHKEFRDDGGLVILYWRIVNLCLIEIASSFLIFVASVWNLINFITIEVVYILKERGEVWCLLLWVLQNLFSWGMVLIWRNRFVIRTSPWWAW